MCDRNYGEVRRIRDFEESGKIEDEFDVKKKKNKQYLTNLSRNFSKNFYNNLILKKKRKIACARQREPRKNISYHRKKKSKEREREIKKLGSIVSTLG